MAVRQLRQMSRNGGQSLLKFMYNADGIRTNKIVDGVNHVYTLNGTQIVSEAWGTNLLIYLYDESGAPIGLQYRTKSYAANVFDTFYFEKNLQGDIIAVYNASGEKIGSYTYDAWGVCTASVVSGNTVLENNIVRTLNPFRYRGYYYDTETGLYYLQSRYYNPAWGRFLNADGMISTGTGLLGYNMYAYCNNNPIMHIDPTGRACECTKKRVRGNHVCRSDEKAFMSLYYEATGNRYDLDGRTVTYSLYERPEYAPYCDGIVIGALELMVNAFLSYMGVPSSAFTIPSAAGTVVIGGSVLPSGKFDVYTVTRTMYYTRLVEVENYHGYRVYEPKTFKRTESEIYYFMGENLLREERTYTDDWLIYAYRNHS